jgi:hypothetical protein
MMVGNNLKDAQLQQIVDKTIIYADKDRDGKISFEEFRSVIISDHNFFYLIISYLVFNLPNYLITNFNIFRL